MFLYNVIFHFHVGGGVSDSHVQAQILPVSTCKGDEQVSRTLFFFTNVKLHRLEDRWFRGLTKITYQLFFSVFTDIFRCEASLLVGLSVARVFVCVICKSII